MLPKIFNSRAFSISIPIATNNRCHQNIIHVRGYNLSSFIHSFLAFRFIVTTNIDSDYHKWHELFLWFSFGRRLVNKPSVLFIVNLSTEFNLLIGGLRLLCRISINLNIIERGLIMRILKKFLWSTFIALVGFSFCFMEASALFGNTHFNLGKKMIELYNKKLTKGERNAFLSGLVYADIGRFKFDKETGINSDSDKFVQEMKKFAQTPEEQWFVRGFAVHVFQDKETCKFLTEVLGHKSSTYLDYIMDCSLIDSYFMKKNGGLYSKFLDKFNFEQITSGWDIKNLSKVTNIPENKINNFVNLALSNYSTYPNNHTLIMYDNLIKKTYQSLGFEISLDEINEQAANVVGAFTVCSILIEKNEIPAELVSTIESKSNNFAQYCMKKIQITE